MFKNLWRETLLLSHLTREGCRLAKVLNFGQLPHQIIYREVEEGASLTLEEFLRLRDRKD